MPQTDLLIVLRFWGAMFLIGAAAFPLTSLLFSGWHDRGYVFSKAVGFSLAGWIVYVLGMARILPFSAGSIWVAVGAIFIIGIIFQVLISLTVLKALKWRTIVAEEVFFLLALLFWTWIKAHEPSIRGLEKFMDYGFMKSILEAAYFPPIDMWYPPLYVNYYYFGHLVTAMLTTLSGLDLSYTFNLMLSSIFALSLTMSFSIGRQLIRGIPGVRPVWEIGAGLLTSLLVTLAGNMQTIYVFTRGYTGDDVEPFWQLLWPAGEFWARLGEGIERYWYANATRFIPFSIHEFPSYSFVVSDVHGHVLSIPFVLLAIALLIHMFGSRERTVPLNGNEWGRHIFYGFLCGVLLMTNALDGPMYAGLFVVMILLHRGSKGGKGNWGDMGLKVGVVFFAAVLASLPFLRYFNSFVTGIAVNCPPEFMANTKVGPILFESVEKCQKSPLWMLWLLWGFFWFTGAALIISRIGGIRVLRDIRGVWGKKFTQIERLLLVFFSFSVLLIIIPEFVYFKDIYPTHFRSNTMFKLGYQAFIMFSIVSGYSITRILHSGRSKGKQLFLLVLLPQLFLVSIYPLFSVRSYFNRLTVYQGIGGIEWLKQQYPDNYAAIQWLNSRNAECRMPNAECAKGIIVEADGDSYTDYNQVSVFTGYPTIIGWAVHEWLWRGSYDVVSPRRDTVRQIYESEDVDETRQLMEMHRVRYVFVGTLEREKFVNIQEWKFSELGKEVFRSGNTVVYEVGGILQSRIR